MKSLHINTRKNINTLKRQAGMTLTESLLVLSVGALVAVLAYGGYKMATNDVKVQSQVTGTVQLVGKIKQVFATAANYSGVTNTNVINAKIVPSDFKISGTTLIKNAWGGDVAAAVGIQGATTPTTSFKITIDSIPAEGCVEFLAGISSAANSLWMGGVTAATNDVKPVGGAFDPAKAAGLCVSSAGDATAVSTAILVTQ